METRKSILRQVCAVAILLMGFGTTAYALDGNAVLGGQEKSLAVKNWKGEQIGTSRHVILDPSTGDIVFIIVALNQEEEREVAVPAVLFSIDKEQGVLVLNVSKKQLNSSPVYHNSDLNDPEFVKKVYQFFSIAPPWTEETPKQENKPFQKF